ncbi:hypothetical protein [Sphaerisporangium aureirubrum]|uniref:Uncharacterized protein n=1 Tax=Sphaerisporangium aureirubrum TaxID=1544736 RepID=A0ABW1NCM9_9ACTN
MSVQSPPRAPAIGELLQLRAKVQQLLTTQTALVELIDHVAVPSLAYVEARHDYDDAARLNLRAGVTEALCLGLPDAEAEAVRAQRELAPFRPQLDDATWGATGGDV